MKQSKILTLFAITLAIVLSLTACFITDNPVEHVCESKCETCGLCTDAECAEDACKDKCAGHMTPEPPANKTTPVISVVPAEIEINAGDDIDLMFGVTVTDEGDADVKVIIADDDDFDATVEGVYTITYSAVNKFENEATATRKITVLKALSSLTLEVQKNILGEQKWTGNLLNFKNKEYHEVNADATFDKQSGVFHNTSDSAITVTVSNSDYAVVAIITANGVVVEGRDGANNRLVNAENPVRGSSTATLTSINAVADNMVIPAGGYAIVVQNGYCGTTVDDDGRGFMNWNVIGTYGNVVRLLWADTAEVITPYVDQAPVVSGHTNPIYAGNGDFVLEEKILEGVTATDDNGTFDVADDVAITVTIKDNGGFDISVAGTYTITLEATDGALTTTVTRSVEVTTEAVEIKINNNAYTTVEALVAVDKDLTSLGKYLFVIYTPNYTGTINWANGYGEAFVINKYGEIVRIYDGANGKYRDADNPTGITDTTKCTATGYLTEAFASRQEGEYILVAPNGNGNVSRKFLLDNRTIGGKVTLPGITFTAHECVSKCDKCGGCLDEACTEAACATKCSCHVCESVCAICGKCTDAECTEEVCASKCEGHDVPAHECESVCEYCAGCKDAACTEAVCATKCAGHENSKFISINGKTFEAVDGKWAYNSAITAATATSKAIWIFDKNYTGTVDCNGYGAAIVLDSYGKLIKVYDGANLGFYQGNGKETAHFTTANYAVTAWNELKDGETLIIFPNGGTDGNTARAWALGLRTDGSIGKVATVTGIEFDSMTKTLTVNGKSFSADLGLWAYNEEITTTNAASKRMWIFDKSYTGNFATNAYGAAIVLNKYGMLVKVYDGANLGFYQGNGKETAHFTTANYAVTAWNELKDGEILIVLPNDGTNGADSARTFGLGLRGDDNFGKVSTLTGFRFESAEKTITIGSKTYTAAYGKWIYNQEITTSTAASYAIVIYDKGYTGTFTTNGYGVALVLSAEGKVLRVYDGANAGYTDANSGVNNKDHGVDVNNFATLAWSELQEGETLVILPNGGSEGNAARQVGLDCRWLIGQKMSITGFTFK